MFSMQPDSILMNAVVLQLSTSDLTNSLVRHGSILKSRPCQPFMLVTPFTESHSLAKTLQMLTMRQ